MKKIQYQMIKRFDGKFSVADCRRYSVHPEHHEFGLDNFYHKIFETEKEAKQNITKMEMQEK